MNEDQGATVHEDQRARLSALMTAAGVGEEFVEYAVAAYAAGDPTDLLRRVLNARVWREGVVPESPGPTSVSEWPRLQESGLPFVDGAAAQRLLDAGADRRDLDAIVRSAQVWATYNVLAVLDGGGSALRVQLDDRTDDSGTEELGWAVVASPPWVTPNGDLRPLHSSFEEQDPTGRHGAPPPRADED
ncbi:MAG: hypothetical protein AB8I08_25785 [Sandaracinaceae bacterium]